MSGEAPDTQRRWLLERAARCYEQVGRTGDAVRCWRALDRPAEAARLAEEDGHFADASRAFAAAGAWSRAARCARQAGDLAEAVEHHLAAGERLQAAWLLAHRLGHRARALGVLSEIEHAASSQPDGGVGHRVDRLGAELVRSRCALLGGAGSEAVRRLRHVLRELPGMTPGVGLRRLESWAVTLAEELGRPDLVATVFAAAVSAGAPGAAERWQAWSLTTLGEASGLGTLPDLGALES